MNSRFANMHLARALRVFTALVVVSLMLAPRARADTVGVETLVQNSVMVSGQHTGVYSFNATGPGVVTVHLENLTWPERLARLDCSIYSNAGFVKALTGGLDFQFVAAGPAAFYANIFAGAGGRLSLGLFSLRITFEPGAALVPLPAGVWLLGSVLGFLGFRRHALPALRFTFGGAQTV